MPTPSSEIKQVYDRLLDYGNSSFPYLERPAATTDSSDQKGATALASGRTSESINIKNDSIKEVKEIVQIPRSRIGDEYDVIPADKYRRRKKVADPDKLYKDYSMVFRKVLTYDGIVIEVRLEIQSEGLCKVLRQIGQPYRSLLNLDVTPIVIRKPFRALFFLAEPLERYSAGQKIGSALKDDVDLLVDFIKSANGIKDTLQTYSEEVKKGKISYDFLWTLFPPGTIINAYFGEDTEECGVVESTEYQITKQESGLREPEFVITNVSGYFAGNKFGLSRDRPVIKKFNGLRDITSANFSILPLHMLAERSIKSTRERLVARGKRYHELQTKSMSHLGYCGPFWGSDPGAFGKSLEDWGSHQVQIQGRVVVDADVTYRLKIWKSRELVAPSLRAFLGRDWMTLRDLQHKYSTASDEPLKNGQPDESSYNVHDTNALMSNATQDKEPPQETSKSRDEDQQVLSEEDYLICTSLISCFFLEERQWGWVPLTRLANIKWDADAFKQLQMPESTKDTLMKLVTRFNPDSLLDFDDVVKGKGKGLVFLLHGEPGLGKTMTAECIAEHAKLPLYHVTTGQLSTDITKLETELTRIFMLGARWKAVVLLDEADVLMSQRTEGDLSRNAVVAVFLRLIEYYRGLIFLTTNRLEGFDTAFYNRIHVKVEYPQLRSDARRKIWENMMVKSKLWPNAGELWIQMVYEILGQLPTNGRSIRNIIRVAHTLGNDGPQDAQQVIKHLVAAIRINCSDSTDDEGAGVDNAVLKLEKLLIKSPGHDELKEASERNRVSSD